MRALRRAVRLAAWTLSLTLLLLVIVWVISTRWYVYANALEWNRHAKEGQFIGFTGGCLVSGVYPSSFMYTEDAAIRPTIAFHARWRGDGWGLRRFSSGEQQRLVLAVMKQQKRFFDIYTPDLKIIESNAYCLPLWKPACWLALAAACTGFLARRIPVRAPPAAPVPRRRWLAYIKYAAATFVVALAAFWSINVIGTMQRSILTIMTVSIERAAGSYSVLLIRGGFQFAYDTQPIRPPRFEIAFDDALYLPRDSRIYGFDSPSVWSPSPVAQSTPSPGTVMRVPIWLLFVPAAIGTAILFFLDRRPHRAPGCCAHCGYDLRGSISGHCPECGHACEQAPTSPAVVRHLPRRRVRRALKWIGATGCAVLLAALAFCLFYSSLVYSDGYRVYGLFAGSVGFESGAPPRSEWILGDRWIDCSDFAKYWKLWIHWHGSTGSLLWIPIWMPLLLIAIPTVWLWRLDGRPAPGTCEGCAYSLTGNTSGTCPECGRRLESPA